MSPSPAFFPGFDPPAAGFEAPLEMLSACHGRVEKQCQTLLRLLPHLAAKGADQAARVAARNVMRYFDTSAQHHHADEEEDLFPALLRSAPPADRAQLSELIDLLLVEHQELGGAWARLRVQLEAVAQGDAGALDGAAVGLLVARYREHIVREEAQLLPFAARVLNLAQLDKVGQAMRLRRGIKEI